MNFNDILGNMQDMAADLEAVRKKYQKEMQEKFTVITQKFFEAAPNIQAVVWEQVVPYFNDGEVCEFSVHTPRFVLNGFDPDDLLSPWEYEEMEGTLTFWSKPKDSNDLEFLCYEFSNTIESNPDLMESMFGSHARIYLTKDKIIFEEYLDHD